MRSLSKLIFGRLFLLPKTFGLKWFYSLSKNLFSLASLKDDTILECPLFKIVINLSKNIYLYDEKAINN